MRDYRMFNDVILFLSDKDRVYMKEILDYLAPKYKLAVPKSHMTRFDGDLSVRCTIYAALHKENFHREGTKKQIANPIYRRDA